jgi:predicted TIM-barrel enzyme
MVESRALVAVARGDRWSAPARAPVYRPNAPGGGADLIIIYNSGRFRMAGRGR